MPSALVTGASGFLGGALSPRLEAAGWEVRPLGRGQAPSGKADAVVHLAQGGVALTRSLSGWALDARVPLFLLASSGNARDPRDDAYGLGRLEEETVVLGAGFARAAALRFHTLFGPGLRNRARLLPRLADAASSGREVEVAAPDGVRLSLTHVEDAAEAVTRCLAAPAARGVLDVAGPDALTVGEIARRLGVPRIVPRPPRTGERDLVGETSTLEAALVWRPERRFQPPYF